MKDFLSIDFESRSTVDLRSTGVYPYAAHPTTDLWCMCYALGDGEVQLWLPGDPVPGEIEYALDNDYDFRAWNAQFERTMWREICLPRYGFPVVPLERWVDTAAEAAAMSLPRGLGKAAEVLGTTHQKDGKGHRLMMQMAMPRKPRQGEDQNALLWWDDEGRLARLCNYCATDVETERSIALKLRRLSSAERKIYVMDQRINDRGVLIDVKLVRALKTLADECMARADQRLWELTDGTVEAVTNVQNIRRWLRDAGVPLDDLTKQTVAETLSIEDLPEGVFEVLSIRKDAGKTSVRKLEAMLKCIGEDNRARGLLLYHGANTGRWSGRLIQPQNFPRPTIKDVESLIPMVLQGDYDGLEALHPILEIVSSLLRSCLIPEEGTRFMCGDFSAIEGHVTAWLAGQDSGMVSYEEMAAIIFDMEEKDVGEESEERQVGKVAVLGCGFGMGVDKYIDTVKAWTGLDILDPDCSGCRAHGRGNKAAHYSCTGALAVDSYRSTNWLIKSLWYDLQSAALEAVRKPSIPVRCGRHGCVQYVVRGKFLWCVLPSGRPLCYPLPRIAKRMTPWGEMRDTVLVSGVNSMTKQWEGRVLYGGLQTENVVQAIARDLMAAAMERVQEAGYDVLLTVHDEVLAEVPNDNGNLEEFTTLMSERPEWGNQIPLAVKGWEGSRYRK